jgi:ketol-acid reductoisomerase
MRDSFEAAGLDIKVTIGLRADSPSCTEAEACGFKRADGTLGDVFDVVSSSDLVVLLISDAAQVRGARWSGREACGSSSVFGSGKGSSTGSCRGP